VILSSTTPGAAIHFTSDGSTPTAASPVATAAIPVGATVTLQAIAVASGYADSAVASATYTIVLPPAPSVTFIPGAPETMGLLATHEFTWQSDTAGSYVVVLGGTGAAGSGEVLATGSVAAGATMAQTVHGTRLTYDGPTPLWVHVTDGLGRTSKTWADLTLKPMATIEVGALGLGRLAVHPGGLELYSARHYANDVAVIDADPESATFNTILATIPVGANPTGLAVTPDGSRVYVTNGGSAGDDSISAISTATRSVVGTIPLTGSASPSGIAITPDGSRAYFLRFDELIAVLDVAPASPSYHSVTASVPGHGWSIAITPDGTRAVVNGFGVKVLDVDPASPSYDTIVATPVAGSDMDDVAVSSDGAVAYATSYGYLCRIDLPTSLVTHTGPFAFQRSFALTPDGATLLMGNPNETFLRVVKGSDLSVIVDVPMGAGLGYPGGIVVTPDGSRAYVERDISSAAGQVVMVPLL
jgi:YVTN family beta-propeller protein